MKRRSFIRNTLTTALGASCISGIYTWQIEPFWIEFVKKKMPIQNLPEKLVGKTLMQISDVHVGNRFDYQYLIDSFIQAQEYNPDFVVYTGDYVNYESDEQYAQMHEVFKFAVKGQIGTVGVLGNHDYGKDWLEQDVADNISDQLERAGINVLSNEQLKIEDLNFIGLDDYWGLNFNPEKVMKNYNASLANVVLCHNPDVCDIDIWNQYNGWILSGHTHGGQCKPPFLNPPMLPVKNKKYNSGEIDLKDGRTLYINRAIGHLWQVRFNTRPEITIFELEQKV